MHVWSYKNDIKKCSYLDILITACQWYWHLEIKIYTHLKRRLLEVVDGLLLFTHWSPTGCTMIFTSRDKLLLIIEWSLTSHSLAANWLQSSFYKLLWLAIRCQMNTDLSSSTHGSLTENKQTLKTWTFGNFLSMWTQLVTSGCWAFQHHIIRWLVPSWVWLLVEHWKKVVT